MDLIDLARQLGKELQRDERYINFRLCQQKIELNNILQEKLNQFNKSKSEINLEMSKENPNRKKIKELNNLLKETYDQIINEDDMKLFNDAEHEFKDLLNRINAIIMQSAQGGDPLTADYYESCGGSCSSCAGCH